jgi:hypothetical protein
MVEPREELEVGFCVKCGFVADNRTPCEVCKAKKNHTEECRYRISLECKVAIECKHGYDVCPKCDPCTCLEK